MIGFVIFQNKFVSVKNYGSELCRYQRGSTSPETDLQAHMLCVRIL